MITLLQHVYLFSVFLDLIPFKNLNRSQFSRNLVFGFENLAESSCTNFFNQSVLLLDSLFADTHKITIANFYAWQLVTASFVFR